MGAKVEPISIGPGESMTPGARLRGKHYAFRERGPRVLVTAGLHGDEPTGPGAVWYLEEQLSDAPLTGSVTVIPCVNMLALQASSRLIPIEGTDLNRCFPGRRDGCLAERLAATLVELLAEHDMLIDVHTAAWCVPFVLLDETHDRGLAACVARWAVASSLPVVREMPTELARLQSLDRSWSAVAVAQGKPALTVELTGFHTLDSSCAQLGRDVLLALLQAAPALASPAGDRPAFPVRQEMYADNAGFFEAFRRPGDQLGAGEVLGVIRSPEGTVRETIRTDKAGLVLAVQPTSAIQVGSFLATLAVSA
jgi:predicted deacylase